MSEQTTEQLKIATEQLNVTVEQLNIMLNNYRVLSMAIDLAQSKGLIGDFRVCTNLSNSLDTVDNYVKFHQNRLGVRNELETRIESSEVKSRKKDGKNVMIIKKSRDEDTKSKVDESEMVEVTSEQLLSAYRYISGIIKLVNRMDKNPYTIRDAKEILGSCERLDIVHRAIAPELFRKVEEPNVSDNGES